MAAPTSSREKRAKLGRVKAPANDRISGSAAGGRTNMVDSFPTGCRATAQHGQEPLGAQRAKIKKVKRWRNGPAPPARRNKKGARRRASPENRCSPPCRGPSFLATLPGTPSAPVLEGDHPY